MVMCEFRLEPKPRNALKLTVFTMREKHIKVCCFDSIIVLDQLAYNDLDLPILITWIMFFMKSMETVLK